MFPRHALAVLILVAALSASSAQAPTTLSGPQPRADRGHLLATTPVNAPDQPEARRRAEMLAPLLVMFIPWAEPKPTPDQPGDNNGGGDNSNGSGGGTNSGSGGTTGGQNGGGTTGGSGNGGNSGGSGGTGDPGSPPKTGTGNPGSGDPGVPVTHPNPEPATLLSGLYGAGLLALAGLRRRRWAMPG
jgi:hypothetical protein